MSGHAPVILDIAGTVLDADDRRRLAHPLTGGLILFARNWQHRRQLTELTAAIKDIREDLLVCVDHEGGRVQRFRKEFTVLPPMRTIGRAYDMDAAAGRQLARQCGWLLAAELRGVGVDISFAPVVDLDYGVSTVIGDRAFHRDPRIVAELAVAFLNGMREVGMHGAAKHFPGHGAVAPDSHVAMPVDRRELADLDDDLYPYQRLIDNGLAAVMAAHVVFSAVDPLPAGFSRKWLQDELRGRLKFGGAIFSDDLSMAGAGIVGEMPQRVRAALQAGCDMVPICNNRQGVLQVIESLRGSADPVSQIRLARLHGKPAKDRLALRRTEEWQTCERSVKACMERPDLQLNA